MKRRDFLLSIAAMLIVFATLHLSAQQPPGFGTYGYDGAGNVTAAGNDAFVYDELGRIRRASLLQGSTAHVQDFTYDRYGNIRTITTSGESNPAVPAVDERTNRINLATSATNMVGTYDAAGNLIRYNGIDAFRYDALNVMTESTVGGERRVYLYSANNERIATLNVAGNAIAGSQWTLRDASAKVLRRLSRDAAGTWRWDEDYIYRGSQLLAAEVPGNTLHFHLDHLGTPRVITGNGGVRIAAHTYYPFGRELTPAQDGERMKFTGHERDATNLDYMHARSYLPWTGRFLSVDPALDIEKTIPQPQKWNRYAYVLNNPMKYTDPNGREENLVGGGTIVNSSSQTVYIAFDGQMGTRSTDYVIPLKPGESSEQFTFDADAVVVGPGQNISGATGGSFKVSAGSVEIKDGKNGSLVLTGSPTYFAMKNRSNPEARSGHQSAAQTPQQWRLTPEKKAEADKQRQQASSTLETRREQKKTERWEKIKDKLVFWR